MLLTAVYFAVYFVSLTAGMFAQKKYSANPGDSTRRYFVYLLVNCSFASLFFWCSGGFFIRLNAATVVYGFLFSAIVACILLFTFLAYRTCDIATIGSVTGAGSLVMSIVTGVFLFSEHITARGYVRIILVILVLGLTYYRTHQAKSGGIGLLYCILIIFAESGCVVLVKFFAQDVRVTDTASFFFLTNLILSCMAFFSLLFLARFRFSAFVVDLKGVRPRDYLLICFSTINANIGSFMSVRLLAVVDVSIYSPMIGALKILSATVLSIFILREKVTIGTLIGVFITIAAVLISF